MHASTQRLYIFMEEIRSQKTIKYKGNLSTNMLFLQNDENALTTFLHSPDNFAFVEENMCLLSLGFFFFSRGGVLLNFHFGRRAKLTACC